MMIATDLETGGKIELKSGSVFDALRATMSIPGLFAPARIKDRWLVDGGLVDPVPVGVARAIEADVVIAVDLNCGLVSRRKWGKKTSRDEKKVQSHREYRSQLIQKLADFYESTESGFRDTVHELLDKDSSTPDIIETVMTSIGIMQERITRINLAVEPPELQRPALSHSLPGSEPSGWGGEHPPGKESPPPGAYPVPAGLIIQPAAEGDSRALLLPSLGNTDRPVQVLRVVLLPGSVLFAHERRRDDEVRRGTVAGGREVIHHGDPQEGLDVNIVRMRLHRVPEEDDKINPALGYHGP
jgi:hypothetical protein